MKQLHLHNKATAYSMSMSLRLLTLISFKTEFDFTGLKRQNAQLHVQHRPLCA